MPLDVDGIRVIVCVSDFDQATLRPSAPRVRQLPTTPVYGGSGPP